MAPAAAYDEIADWYEREFLARDAAAGGDPLGIGAALDTLLGPGQGPVPGGRLRHGRARGPGAGAGLDAVGCRHIGRDAAARP